MKRRSHVLGLSALFTACLPAFGLAQTPADAVLSYVEAARSFAHGLLPMVNELAAAGLSLNAIARQFNEDGIRSRRGGVWTAKAIANLKAIAA